MNGVLPTVMEVQAAAGRLQGVTRLTPLVAGTPLDEQCGGRVLIKLETLQHTGSFKARGAYNRLVQLSPAERVAGVVAFSSGNHAQGVAWAARLLDLPAVIVMPSDAPRTKLDNTRSLGAEVVTYDRTSGNREQIAADLARQRGATLVPSYDDPHIIAGQGTVGLELMQQASAMGRVPDDVIIGCSGGGLLSGSALAIKEISPATVMHAAEPQAFDDTRRSLESGHRVANPPGGHSICDALQAPTPGELTFAVMRSRVADGFAVSDDEVRRAMAWAWRHLKTVVEPGGAVGLAALLAGRLDARGRTVALVPSGGNVDAGLYSGILSSSARMR